ncbi:MAG TPA: MoaD/ThiS family protein [Daejeonella sp.]|jgi:molybdopterin converting factor small subunit|uniref:MoaD/ThiS family protein n=1 Tax=Daejeonella sp. TaxID=2805397 RepID=UPI002ED78592
MQVHLTLFGQLADITGKTEMILHDIPDTETLIKTLNEMYPSLANAKYAIALNKKVIKENTSLSGDNNIALLPPFSGG